VWINQYRDLRQLHVVAWCGLTNFVVPFAVTINGGQLRTVIAAGRRVSLSESDGPINGERAQTAEICATVK
jgi:hypothetical protein